MLGATNFDFNFSQWQMAAAPLLRGPLTSESWRHGSVRPSCCALMHSFVVVLWAGFVQTALQYSMQIAVAMQQTFTDLHCRFSTPRRDKTINVCGHNVCRKASCSVAFCAKTGWYWHRESEIYGDEA